MRNMGPSPKTLKNLIYKDKYNMKLINYTLLSILLTLIAGCTTSDYSHQITRAHDPWVFRSVLDAKARMLTVALNDNLWVAYSAKTGALYKAWRGGVNFDGAVYTTVHGPQPSSLGDGYLVNKFQEPWVVEHNGAEELPNIQFRGHRFEKEKVVIQYDLLLKNGQVIKIEEHPEYLVGKDFQTGFERKFVVEGLPEGAQLKFNTNLSSIVYLGNIETNGTYEVLDKKKREAKGLNAIDVDLSLQLNPNEPTYFRAFFTKKPLITNENKVVGAEDEEIRPLGYRLIARDDCKTCHNAYVKTVGPAYIDIARKYRDNESNIALLTSKVINGGSGVWGEAAMTAHHESAEEDIREMVNYIMSLDADEEAELASLPKGDAPEDTDFLEGEAGLDPIQLFPGAVIKVFQFDKVLNSLADVNFNQTPLYQGVVPLIHAGADEMGGLESNFAILATGYINIPKSNNYVFRLASDDGSKLYIDDVELIDHDGLHGADPKDGEIALSEGYHPFRLEYFQGAGGKSYSLQWRSFNDDGFKIVPTTALVHHKKDQPVDGTAPPMNNSQRIPGDTYPLTDVHPSFTLSQARPNDFLPKVGGMDFLSDGRLVVSTWDAEGGIFIVDGVQSGDPAKMSVKKIARGLAEPLGVKVVDDEIYVLQKQELTKLIDHNGDDIIDEYFTLCNAWQVSANFHEFSFGLAYKEGYFYAALAIAILPGGASANPQIPHRGKAVRIAKEDGKLEFIAEGLRTPNGVGIGVDGEIFIADNQGDWLPSSKILHVRPGDFFGSRAVDSARVAQLPVKQPVVWLPQDEIGNSPTVPLALDKGPYQGQMIHGEVTHGGVKRVFVEKVDGEYQGCVFRFIQGLEAGVNRMVWGPDGGLYIGGIGSTGNWRHDGKLWYGLQRLQYNSNTTFEMLAVRARTNGLEIEFTEALPDGVGWNPSDYEVQQWWYLPTHDYGGPKKDVENLRVLTANVSADRKKVFLELPGLKEGHLQYIRLPFEWTSESGRELWSTEAWYNMNKIPQNNPGERLVAPPPIPPNTLTEREKAAGWTLLFDGLTTNGWRNFGKSTIGSSWKVVDGTLTLDAQPRNDGGWQAADGGDIITDGEYENYELQLEWKISPCGNSGIIYNVAEAEEYDYVWHTGPEMQILDNTCHPDAKIQTHRASDLYDMIECKYITVKPAGNWNKVRLKVDNGKVEHWLNGRKVVEFEMFNQEWERMIANSKFKDMPAFGKSRKGHIALQDHGNRVWFRNIKILNIE